MTLFVDITFGDAGGKDSNIALLREMTQFNS